MEVDIELLKRVMGIQSKSNGKDTEMLAFIVKQFVDMSGADIKKAKKEKRKPGVWTAAYDEYNNLYVTKGQPAPGEFYPAVVCHIDTVHEITDNFTVFEHHYSNGEHSMWAMDLYKVKQVGIGGDDKVGIYITLEMLRTLPFVKCVFFRDEEIGCKGSQAADLKFFDDCAFVIQADRMGAHDFIRTSGGTVRLFSRRFERSVKPMLKKYGFIVSDDGRGSDTPTMKRKGLGICVANVSCGYFRPHENSEFIEVNCVGKTLSLFHDICTTLYRHQWKHVWRPLPERKGYWDKDIHKWIQPTDPTWNKKAYLEAEERFKETQSRWGGGYGYGYGYMHGEDYDSIHRGPRGNHVAGAREASADGAKDETKTTGTTSSGSTTDSQKKPETPRGNSHQGGTSQTSGSDVRDNIILLPPARTVGNGHKVLTEEEFQKELERKGKDVTIRDTESGIKVVEGSFREVADKDHKVDEARDIIQWAKARNRASYQQYADTRNEDRTNWQVSLSFWKKTISLCEICNLDCIVHLYPEERAYFCENCDRYIPYPMGRVARSLEIAKLGSTRLSDMDEEDLLDLLSLLCTKEDFLDLVSESGEYDFLTQIEKRAETKEPAKTPIT